eukprot:9941429-Ditylum_brightwellii.AAC.1
MHLYPSAAQFNQQGNSAGKRAFEAHLHKHNIVVQYYHTNNGRFADNTFVKAVVVAQQTISYCGEGARIQLHYAKSRWPSVIDFCVWPNALSCRVHLDNIMPNKADGACPLEEITFASRQIHAKMECKGKARHKSRPLT